MAYCLLKLADRISNLTALGFVHDAAFVKKYLEETQACVLPHAERVNADMFRELSDLVENRRQLLPRLRNLISPLAMLPSDTQKFHSGRQPIRP